MIENCSLKRKRKNKLVYFRIAPCMEPLSIGIQPDKKTVHLKNRDLAYKSDGIFYGDSQDETCSTLLQGFADDLYSGKNSIIICYGQSESGKTYTVFGTDSSYNHRGLVPRMIEQLFETQARNQNIAEISFQVSFVEFNNRYTRDLIENKIVQREAKISKHTFKTQFEGLRLIFAAMENRIFTDEEYFERHINSAIISIYTTYKSTIRNNPIITRGKMQIVDLASVHLNYDPTQSPKITTKQSKLQGNIAMSQITIYLRKLLKKKEKYLTTPKIPILEHMKNNLSPECIVTFVGHLRGGKKDSQACSSVIRFISSIFIRRTVLKEAVEQSPELAAQYYKDEINKMNIEMLRNFMITGQEQEIFMHPDRMDQMERILFEYIDNRQTDVGVISLIKISKMIHIFKKTFAEMKSLQAMLQQENDLLCQQRDYFKQNNDSKRQSSLLMGKSSRNSKTKISKSKMVDEVTQDNIQPETIRVGELQRDSIVIGPMKEKGKHMDTTKYKSNKYEPELTATDELIKQYFEIPETEVEQQLPERYNLTDLKNEPDKINHYINMLQKDYMAVMLKYEEAYMQVTNLLNNLQGVNMSDRNAAREIKVKYFDKVQNYRENFDQMTESLKDIEKKLQIYSKVIDKVPDGNKQIYYKVARPFSPCPSEGGVSKPLSEEQYTRIRELFSDKGKRRFK